MSQTLRILSIYMSTYTYSLHLDHHRSIIGNINRYGAIMLDLGALFAGALETVVTQS